MTDILARPGPEVRTTSGRVRGLEADGVARWIGVPYAAPPVRFAAPEPAPAWDGVRDATAPGPNAPQPPRPFALDLTPVLGQGWRAGDDYLTADVWAPADARDLPVMVFLHGGAFVAGEPGAPLYDGTVLAGAGVVLVTVTYRLAVEGFLPLDGGATNLGLRDMIAALGWVRQNAGAFGGDPGAVTVFGESAGAMSIGCLLASPAAEGLFSRAIVQSGGAEMVRSPTGMREFGARFAAEMGVRATADAVGERPLQDALSVLSTVMDPARRGDLREADGIDPGFGLGVLCPVVGDDVVPVRPLDAIRDGAGAGVAVIAGSNTDEMNLYLVPSGVRDAMTAEAAERALSAVHPDAPALLAAASGSPGERYAAVLTDLVFRGPTGRLLEAHGMGSGQRSWGYELAWRSPAFGGALGACHGLDLPFVFGNLACASGPDALAGPEPPRALSDEMVTAWTAFARTGDPGWAQHTAGAAPHRFA